MPEPRPDRGSIRHRSKIGHHIIGAIEDSGLVKEGDSGVVLVSGGADSVALLIGLVPVVGPKNLVVLHVNYGLREEAGQDEELVRSLCERLGVSCEIHKAGEPEGNLQAWAREVRLREAERIRTERELDWIAIGHNRTDQAETFLYRLASSPGARSLLAMPPRSGHVIRPLLSLDRSLIRRMLEYAEPYADDVTNREISFARNRIRHQVIPPLEAVNPAAQLNIVRTRAELAEDDDALTGLARAAATGAVGEIVEALSGQLLAGQHPAIQRRMIRVIAESGLGRPVAVSSTLAADAVRLAEDPEGGKLDLGGGDLLLIEAGHIRAVSGGGAGEGEVPGPVAVDLDRGQAVFGGWEVVSDTTTEADARSAFGNPWWAFLDQGGLLEGLLERSPGPDDLLLTLRSWRSGDRIEPLGMQGSKSLQDVFTDALVPASRRRSWPVLVNGESVIWVPGLVRSRHLLIGGPDKPVLRLHARPPFHI